jgi:hypothetical protein
MQPVGVPASVALKLNSSMEVQAAGAAIVSLQEVSR